MIDRIRWLGHGSFVIEGPPLIYINPWRITRVTFHADVILLGHDHYEHFSPVDIEKLRGEHTIILGNEKIVQMVNGATLLRPWHSMILDRARITALPAYSPNDHRHPIQDGGLGFLISLNFYDIYYAGDTKITPEMERIQPDIAILPIDNNGTLDVNEAVEVVRKLRPRYVYPANWGAGGESASRQDAEDFKEKLAGRFEVILPENKKVE
jgi:L-ascorbate metabolism protein UlaG (beta-lactamase superfamily)